MHLLGDPSSNSPLVALPLTVCCLDGCVSSQSSSSSSTEDRTNRLQTQNHFFFPSTSFCFYFLLLNFTALIICKESLSIFADLPEALEQHVVELVFTEGSGDGDEEGLSKQRRARVVISWLLVLFSQVHWDHYVVCVLHSVHRHLKAAERHVVNPLESRWLSKMSTNQWKVKLSILV